MDDLQLGLRSRGRTYAFLLGSVVGVLVAGLAVPFGFGEQLTAGRASNSLPAVSGAVPSTAAAGGSGPAGGSPAAVPGAHGTPPVAGAGISPGTATGTSGRPRMGPVATPRALPPGTRLTASDVGVTATTIKIGVPDVKLAGVSLGNNIDPKDYWKALVGDVNSHGGVNGRKIVLDFATVDLGDYETQAAAACRKWTEDDKVFAVVASGGFFGPPVRCITEEHRTPFINYDGQDESYYASAKGMLFSTGQGKHRIMRNFGYWLDRGGYVRNHKIGLLASDGFDRPPVDQGLLPVMSRLGYTFTDKEYISLTDRSAAPGQIAVAVQNMKAKGVDVVLAASNLLYQQLFVQQAEKQQYFPKYFASDFAGMTTDLLSESYPQSWDGTIGVTGMRTGEERVGLPEPALDAHCRQVVAKATGQAIARGSVDSDSIMLVCGPLQRFVAGAIASGAGLTRPLLSQAIQQQGDVLVPFQAGSSFRPGKFDASDFERTVQWHFDCKCWKPVPHSVFTRSQV